MKAVVSSRFQPGPSSGLHREPLFNLRCKLYSLARVVDGARQVPEPRPVGGRVVTVPLVTLRPQLQAGDEGCALCGREVSILSILAF